MINLYNIDCMEFMKEIPDKYYDIAIVDPPYGIGECGKTNKTRGNLAIAKDYKTFFGLDKNYPEKQYFNVLSRISKNTVIFGANHFIENIPNNNSSCWLVWDKNNGNNDFADCELAYTSFNSAVRIFKYTWNGMIQEDMKNKEVRIHPTQKPVALYKWILKNYAKDGDKILDTHFGSGSIAIACHDLMFSLDGCELDNHYFNLAKERYETHIAQGVLF